MYQSDRFLEFARDYLDEEINDSAIQEIRDLRRLDERIRLQDMRKKREYLEYRERKEKLLKQIIILEEELKFLNDKRGFIEESLSEQYNSLNNSDPGAFDDSKMIRLKHDLKSINSSIEHIKSNILDLNIKERIIRNKTMHNTRYK